VTPVFGHGRLRLYLLKLLAESPRHGYEVMQLLEERFLGLYQPSAGTIYPRLARLEAEGLVSHRRQGGRKVYEITPAGRAELEARREELAALEAEIRDSVHGLAEDVRVEVRGTVHDVRAELKQAAQEMRRQQKQQRHRNQWEQWMSGFGTVSEPPAAPPPVMQGLTPTARDLERRIDSFSDHARDVARRVRPTDAQLAECATVLDDALERIRQIVDEQG
jgi:DNA-binding PadR family transcriptional regulator